MRNLLKEATSRGTLGLLLLLFLVASSCTITRYWDVSESTPKKERAELHLIQMTLGEDYPNGVLLLLIDHERFIDKIGGHGRIIYLSPRVHRIAFGYSQVWYSDIESFRTSKARWVFGKERHTTSDSLINIEVDFEPGAKYGVEYEVQVGNNGWPSSVSVCIVKNGSKNPNDRVCGQATLTTK